MADRLSKLIQYFPSGTAEGEAGILDKVFVFADEFRRVLSPPNGNPHLLIGSKGSGKTAVLSFASHILEKDHVPTILLTPSDIDTSKLTPEHSTGDLQRILRYQIILSIIDKLAFKEPGLFSGAYETLHQAAVEWGLRDATTQRLSVDFFRNLPEVFSGKNISASTSHLVKSTQDDVQEAIREIVGTRGFYLFIDDTDQIANPEIPGHLNRVWALILAVRSLSRELENFRAVVSLRSEVWARLQFDERGQRDQTDHFKRLTVFMNSDREHIGRILDRRLSLAAAEDRSSVDGWQHFFDGASARPPTSNEERLWRDLILVRTRQRPRDAIQLINELANASIKNKSERITEAVFQKILPSFSRSVAEQMSEELRGEFPQAGEYLRSLSEAAFSQGGFTMSADDALRHFERLLPRYGATIHGTELSQQSRDSAFRIWSIFYQSGILNARISDSTKTRGFRHLDVEIEPHLVRRTRWNEIQAALWEVNPVYRDYLIELQHDRETRAGLPTKRRRRR